MTVAFIVRTFEEDATTFPQSRSAVPIVEHVFRGPTREQAFAVYTAHLRSDRFLAQCAGAEGMFDGRVRCRSTFQWKIEP